jgi:hypothetical protein
MHTRLIVNGVLEDFLQKGDSWLAEANLLLVDEQK